MNIKELVEQLVQELESGGATVDRATIDEIDTAISAAFDIGYNAGYADGRKGGQRFLPHPFPPPPRTS